MPGFNDAHLHLASGGRAKLAVDLEGAKSISEFQQRVRARVPITKPGEWVTGSGWDTRYGIRRISRHARTSTRSRATIRCFSRISPGTSASPIPRRWISGITASTPNPSGGKIEHDAKGEPDGMLEEDSAMSLVTRKIPAATPVQRRHGIELAMQEATANGLTSIQDYSSWNDFLTYRELKQEGKLTVRVTEWLTFELPLGAARTNAARGRHG